MDATRFRKIVGLLGSDQAGERSAAALKATAMLREAGKTWADVGLGDAAATTSRGTAAAGWAQADLWRKLLDDERTRTTNLSNQLQAAQKEIARLMGGKEPSAGMANPKKPKPRRIDVEEDALRRNVGEVLDECLEGDLELSARTIEFLASVRDQTTWTEAQRDAVEQTLKWVNAGRRAA